MKLLKVRAPGRVNLIGEHTDYNFGFVLPCAINKEVTIQGRKRKDKRVILHSINFAETVEINLGKKFFKRGDWSDYLVGVIKEYEERGFPLSGMELEISGNIPIGAGLSSSAALEVATALFIKVSHNFKIEKKELAFLCQKAENSFVGVSCGIMDQFACIFSQRNFAIFLDCRDLSYTEVPLPLSRYKIILADTKKQRKLSDSAYNQRRKECQQATSLLSEEA
ncbi:MAG: galactokinase, partial [Candidatus Omnitrophica bacterium]|nr:galactokinase [Candidatus Omnitrophota bacterium]